jgi:DnaJ-class molecular chaperone
MKPLLKLSPRELITTVSCQECSGHGLIKLWSPGRPETTHMARCEQCSGFGKVKS